MGLLPADYGFHYVIHIVNEENDGRPLLLLQLPFFFYNHRKFLLVCPHNRTTALSQQSALLFFLKGSSSPLGCVKKTNAWDDARQGKPTELSQLSSSARETI